MLWFGIALLGYFFLALTFILDKIILTKSVGKPIVYTFYSTIFMFGVLLAVPFGVELLQGVDWCWAIVSGMAFGFGLWTLYKAVKSGEASHINPFNGAVVTIVTYALSSYFLLEKITGLQLAGIGVLIFASLLLSFEKSKKHSGFHMGFVLAIISGVFFAISHVSAKYLYELYPFFTGFIWTRATTGLVGLSALLSPAVWKTFGRGKVKKKSKNKKHTIFLVVSAKMLGVLAVLLIQYAMAIGSVSLVIALSGLQYALMFLLIIIFTKFAPKLFKEYFTKRELVVEWVAILLVIVGSALFVL
ncbi:MAG: hypothetical protein COX81_00360 [Candidatus Magasanikbacteria bacterium CG_4_10_14_0_2_um_filter_37_12]|uniref:EamA domain-containing protein n=1 Tax=Candidatus Magasanikbacteria bacterium CG_4_10_14_0_2_um_filter_37_12 TaxID=1974637 RepID=A0A2M7V9X5_9BACT|nr:MAG: hypothetical protein COX81_00360 [Candidatus Magasanikbacteria bacterium CG_4_10_14_0_2_um_filter_37_12]